MQFQLNEAIVLLARTPSVLRAMLHGLPDHWQRSNYGDKTFSPFDVVGHLIHADQTNWLARLNHILANGPTKPFPPFDRYAMFESSKDKSMADLLDELDSVRKGSLQSLHNLHLREAQLDHPGLHPELGRVTAKQLLASWVTHDLHHTAQICKAMARQYRDEVGPWRQYISILG
ncbi:MAG TPA: DinB family protein [Phycisphaerales bacterium]|nr:DinB family protein [Phycisphaerales bacterium]